MSGKPASAPRSGEPRPPSAVFARSLALVSPRLPEALAGETCLRAMLAIAELIPAPFAGIFGFESRLGEEPPEVDLAAGAAAADAGIAPLGEPGPANPLAGLFGDDPTWRSLASLARDWSCPGTPLHRRVHSVWLEFDRVCAGVARPAPGYFLGFGSDGSGTRSGRPVPPSVILAILHRALPGQGGGFPEVRRRAQAFLDALPAEAWVDHVGLLLPRGVPAVRMELGGMDAKGLVKCLADLGWPGSRSEARAWLEALEPHGAELCLHLDIGTELLPKAGIQLSFWRSPGRPVLPRWRKLLDDFTARGLCLERKAEGLLAWGQALTGSGGPWDPGAGAQALAQGLGVCGFERRISHLKLVLDGAGAPAVKGYFGARLLPAWPGQAGLRPHPGAKDRTAGGN